ncbi:MAG: Hsp33 family molecular chaperone HslO [Emcibacter sp.]|nr:Hsp33 family molecular chaperone HslO [Emcibacter sp.]
MTPLYTDHCLSFQIDGQDIKGRIIRLDMPLNKILAHYDHPDDVKRELGKAMVLTAMLGSMMKFDGILTLQISSDGIIKTLISDFATDGSGSGVVRGYYRTDDDIKSPEMSILGQGQLMITMDQGQYMDRYQGIVKLEGGSLKKSAEEYFYASEQLPTKLMISCDKQRDGSWCAAAIMIQHLARNTTDEKDSETTEDQQQDQWNHASIMLSSIKNEELLNKELSLQDLLFRLYHESGVRVFSATEIMVGCRCSEDKLRTVLANFDTEELKDIAKDGIITMTCDFCKTDHKFELKKLIN